MYDYDVLFIGSGHACNHGAMMLKMSGKNVAFVESYLMGGTCTNYGCDAKILLDGPFEFKEGLERYNGLAVEDKPVIDWTKLMAYKKQVIGALDPTLLAIFTQMGIPTIKGRGRLLDAHTVDVDGQKVTAEYIVIGTGARNSKLNIPGSEYAHGSKEFLDIDVMPERIVFIGAGVISMEFASMALALGKKVTVIEYANRSLLAYPEKYAANIVNKMQEQGAEFRFGEAAASIEKVENGYKVTTVSGFSVVADYVLDATGRIANVEDLGLEELGIMYSRRGIKVDDHMRTSVSNIFASGDVVDKTVPKLTPTAEYESNYIASVILGNPAPIEYPVIPNLVFTLPRIAQVGVAVDEAKNDPRYRVVEVPYGKINEWIDNRETDIEITYIFDEEGYLAGAAIYGCEAGTWIDFLTLIINQRLTQADMRNMIFAFPTQTYTILMGLIPMMKQ